MLRVLILLSLLVLSRCLAAEPLKLDHLKAGSQVFSNVTVVGANATDLFITHAKGSANVKLKYLDPELQKRFGYDPDAAAQAEQQQAKQERRYETTVAASIAGTAKNKEGPKPTSDESLADPVSEKSPLGKPAPAVEVEKWLGETPVLKGKFVLVSFWAPWSAPSRKVIPQLNALQKQFAAKLQVVALTSEPADQVEAMTEPKIEFASAIDSKAKMRTTLGVFSLPTVALIDPKGALLYQGHPAALNPKQLEAVLAKYEE